MQSRRGKTPSITSPGAKVKTLDFGEAIRKRLNTRLDNDTPRDSCQGCLNTTHRQLLWRIGEHFKALWKEAKSARKCLGGALGGTGRSLLISHKHPRKHSGAFFNSKITRYPRLAIISYRWHVFSYCSLFNSSCTEMELYLPDGTLPLSFTVNYRVSGL